MKLKRIDYKSAVFFGGMGLLITLWYGFLKMILNMQSPSMTVSLYKTPFVALTDLVITPLSAMIGSYLSVVVIILAYNFVAKKYPVSWTVKK